MPEALRARGWAVERHDDHFDQDTPDQVLLVQVAERGWAFVTQDKRIRRRPLERQALLDAGLGVFAVSSTANLSAEETAAVLIAAEEGVFEAFATVERPFVFGIHKDGSLHRLDVK